MEAQLSNALQTAMDGFIIFGAIYTNVLTITNVASIVAGRYAPNFSIQLAFASLFDAVLIMKYGLGA